MNKIQKLILKISYRKFSKLLFLKIFYRKFSKIFENFVNFSIENSRNLLKALAVRLQPKIVDFRLEAYSKHFQKIFEKFLIFRKFAKNFVEIFRAKVERNRRFFSTTKSSKMEKSFAIFPFALSF